MMRKFFDFIFSMQFAGTLMLIFAAAVGTATFIENDFGTLAAKSVVYSAKWFEALLALTAVSLIGSVFKYKLYERKRYSVLFFHLSFVVILIGAALTRYIGYEGTMMIREGEASNQIISESPYVQVTVNKNGQSWNFDEEYLFTEYKKNRFRESFHFNDESFKLQFKEYIPNAAEAVVEANNGIPMMTFVTVDRGSRRTSLLKAGEVKTVRGLALCFNAPTDDSTAIRINYSPETGLTVRTPFPSTVMNMMAGTTDTLRKDSTYTLYQMQLYDFMGMQFVVRQFYPSGKTQLVSSPHESSGVAAIVMNLSYNGKTEEVGMLGGKGMIGQPVTTSIDGTEFSLSYGSKYIGLPFYIKLRDFILERYPGSNSPSSFASEVTVIDPSENLEMPYRIFMNNILNYGGYRFFQSSYDKDEKGTVLSVNSDYWGTLFTYIGYAILAAGLLYNFFSRNSRFRKLARMTSELKKKSAMAMIAILIMVGFSSENAGAQHDGNFNPLNISKEHAKKFGELIVQDQDGRMKPVNTLSSELLRKIYRKDTYKGLNSEQVFLGMLTNPEYWQNVPLIKVSDKELKNAIGIDGKFASFNDFIDNNRGFYKLSQHIEASSNKKPVERNSFDKDVIKVDERVNIFYMAILGDFLTAFPEPGHPNHKWHTAEKPYESFDSTDAAFVENILPLYYGAVHEAMVTNDWSQADTVLSYLKTYQQRYGEQVMPSSTKTRLEILYNNTNIFKRLFPIYGTIGFIFIIALFTQVLSKRLNLKWIVRVLVGLIIACFALHTLGLAIRWYVAGHAPWSNGYETMIYIAWGTVLSGILFLRKSPITTATTAILASVTLMVANLSWLDPQMTNLVPVLKSYWLVIHVAVITASYSFLGVGALLGFLNMILIGLQTKNNYKKLRLTIEELTNINEMNLIIGVFLITIGTFLGAVWANESWGRYWGWDPKETWALVTVLVYSFIIHMRLIPGLNGVYGFNMAALWGFSSVLMTYFGVNYYLSGMHSYAAGDPVPIPTFVYYSVAVAFLVSLLSYLNHLRMKRLN
ncbi:MAG: cytochrome c biogenesis protein CcsA [Bacteroidales bacterium]|nr:cytochrome c biogenesis protein CcsA [Bacteroidales bacterium]